MSSDFVYKSGYRFQVGEPCWIVIGEHQDLAGYWKGEITEFQDGHYGATIKAKITDASATDLKPRYSHMESYLGYVPDSCRILPRSKHLDALIEEIRKLEEKIKIKDRYYSIRENAFKEAFAAVGKGK